MKATAHKLKRALGSLAEYALVLTLYLFAGGLLVGPWVLFAGAPGWPKHSSNDYAVAVFVAVDLLVLLDWAFNRRRWKSRRDRIGSGSLILLSVSGIVAAFAFLYLQLQHSPGGCVDAHPFSHLDAAYLTVTTFTSVGSGYSISSETCRAVVGVQSVVGVTILAAGLAAVVTHLVHRTTDAVVAEACRELRDELATKTRSLSTDQLATVKTLLAQARALQPKDRVLRCIDFEAESGDTRRSLTAESVGMVLRQIEDALNRVSIGDRASNLRKTIDVMGVPPQAGQLYNALREAALRRKPWKRRLRQLPICPDDCSGVTPAEMKERLEVIANAAA